MKRILFVFFICLLSSTAWAQPKVYSISNAEHGVHARTAASTAVLDTMEKLPFIHDFHTLYYPIDYIDNNLPSTAPITVTTLRFHGLKSKDKVFINSESGTTNAALAAALTGPKYVKVLSPYSFELYDDIDLLAPISRNGQPTIYIRIKKEGAYITDIPDSLSFYNNNGGALVNTTASYAINPISYYCVSFDGLDAKGTPYNTTNPLAVGYTDNLTSQALDLAPLVPYTPADSLYMSFYYQNAGFGDAPDLTDRLELEFFQSTGEWTQVWSKTGGSSINSDSFYLAMVVIKDPLFFHKGFQFRFKSYGRQSGTYDVWNLDYIYINKGRTILTPHDHRDFSISTVDESILKDYTAMPYWHFASNQSAFLKTSLSMVTTNQSLDTKTRTYRYYLSDNINPTSNYYKSTNTAVTGLGAWRQKYTSTMPTSLTNLLQPLHITQKYVILDSLDTDNKNLTQPFDCMFNNIVERGTTLHDYYAYDDKTAEFAFGSNSSGSKIGVQFRSEVADILTHIDICFAQSKGGNLAGLKIFLTVWNGDRTVELRRQILTIKYTDFMNGFRRFALETPLALAAGEVFHVGYSQNFNALLTLGYDRNNDHTNKIFYNTNGTWRNLSNDPGTIKGSLMIHPVFDKGELLTTVQEEQPVSQKKTLELYPNPAHDYLSVLQQDDLQYHIYSLYGEVVASGTSDANNRREINIESFASGMYIIVGTDKHNNTYTARFVKE